MFQQITLVGNLGRDPEMRYTPSGVPVQVLVSPQVNAIKAKMDNGKIRRFGFGRQLGRTAETVSQYLTKGSKVLIVGELEEPRTWVDKEGNTQVSLEVRIQTIRFLSARGDNAGNGSEFPREQPARAQSNGGKSGNRPPEMMDDGPTDEDIPF